MKHIKWIIPVWGMVDSMEQWNNKEEISWKTFLWFILSIVEMLYTFAAFLFFTSILCIKFL